MKAEGKARMGRRDFLRVLGAGAGAAATPAVLISEADAAESDKDAKKARYQANSPDVQNFYRVNHYPQKK
ncbi:MAG TPA: twin-arginine translocation signal domain-containing protein [Pseudolabrys sp.]|nr:twin-arginine translocation signal domain-containing protein [Pseudolabrys sp.]